MRRPDWEPRLLAVLDANAKRPFLIGRWDCARFSAECVKAQTGKDPMKGLRRRYSTERGALRLMVEIGGLEAFMDERFERVASAFAQRGDVVMVDGNLGVCVGGEAVFVGREDGRPGLVREPRHNWSAAWRV